MAFRVSVSGGVIEVDTPAEAVALIKARGQMLAPIPAPQVAPPPAVVALRRPLVLTLHEERVGSGWTRFRLITRRDGTRIVGPECVRCRRPLRNSRHPRCEAVSA